MTDKRQKLMHQGGAIERSANIKLLVPENIAKGDNFDSYPLEYYFLLMDQELTEIKEKALQLAGYAPSHPIYPTLQVELVLECGDLLNNMRFLCQHYNALDLMLQGSFEPDSENSSDGIGYLAEHRPAQL